MQTGAWTDRMWRHFGDLEVRRPEAGGGGLDIEADEGGIILGYRDCDIVAFGGGDWGG